MLGYEGGGGEASGGGCCGESEQEEEEELMKVDGTRDGLGDTVDKVVEM